MQPDEAERRLLLKLRRMQWRTRILIKQDFLSLAGHLNHLGASKTILIQ